MGLWRIYSNPDPHGARNVRNPFQFSKTFWYLEKEQFFSYPVNVTTTSDRVANLYLALTVLF
jgi:hypothetical protein